MWYSARTGCAQRTTLHISVVPDPDFWSPIRKICEIFLDPDPDWISFLLKPDPDPDYPKRFEHFLIFLCFVVHSKGSESPYSTGHDVKCVRCNSITDIKHDLARTRSGITHLQ